LIKKRPKKIQSKEKKLKDGFKKNTWDYYYKTNNNTQPNGSTLKPFDLSPCLSLVYN
jgi:hypothetical protein